MKFTLSWLKTYLKGDYTLQQIEDALTHIGLEVESVADESRRLQDFKSAHITETRRHPDADRLQICTLDLGGGESLEVVCGGANARAGINVVLAPVGAVIPSTGTVLKKGKVRGVDSPGMLCSKDELLLSQGGLETVDGIIELPQGTQPGTPVAEALNLADPVMDIAITPNRSDCFAVYGVARDLHAYFSYHGQVQTTLEPLTEALELSQEQGTAPVIHNHAPDVCPMFGLVSLRGVDTSKVYDMDLYAALTRQLRATDHKVIDPLVDVTNYMCLAYGRPMHVFDADTIQGDITLTLSKGGESFEGLDDVTYTLPKDALIICDAGGIISLAGIMGGKRTACTSSTRHVVVESALFDPACIAKTGQALNLISDARMRFERGVDGERVAWGLYHGVALMQRLCAGHVDGVSWSKPVERVKAPSITLHHDHVTRMLGSSVSSDEIRRALESLGCTIREHHHDATIFEAPSWRHDMTQPVDAIEEILRLRGIDTIDPVSLPAALQHMRQHSASAEDVLKMCLVEAGYHEAINFSFISHDRAAYCAAEDSLIHLKNPLTVDLATMRPSLLPSLLANTEANQKQGVDKVALFECAPVYGSSYPMNQTRHLSGMWHGPMRASDWRAPAQCMDFYQLKEQVMSMLSRIGMNSQSVVVTPLEMTSNQPHPLYHPGRSAAIKQGRTTLCHFGEMHPRFVSFMDIQGAAHGFEFFLDHITMRPKKYNDSVMSPYQRVERDFAFVLDASTPVGSIESVLHQKLSRQTHFPKHVTVEAIHIFDIFQGLEDGQKSVAVRLTLQPTLSTLTEEELSHIMHAVINCVESETGGRLRQ